jgi:hypothetical protein
MSIGSFFGVRLSYVNLKQDHLSSCETGVMLMGYEAGEKRKKKPHD